MRGITIKNLLLLAAVVAAFVAFGIYASLADDRPDPSDVGIEDCAELRTAYQGAKQAKERSDWPSDTWQFHAERQNELWDALGENGCLD